MKVFISWSGERSRAVAEALRVWLPRVIQSVRPWMSDADISAGSRWLSEVSHELDETSVGIICVTQENLNSPWLHFEAGALSKSLDQSRVCPVGLNLKPGQIKGPLSQFQAVTLDEGGMFRILGTLNKLIPDQALPDTELKEIFAVWWPNLCAKLGAIPDAATPVPVRATEDQLEELLQIAREQLRRENLRLEASQVRDDRFDEMIQLMEKSASALEPMNRAMGGIQSELVKSLKDLQRESDGEAMDPKMAQVLSLLSSRIPAPPKIDLQEMTSFIRSTQEQSRLLTDGLLSTPKSTDKIDPPPSV